MISMSSNRFIKLRLVLSLVNTVITGSTLSSDNGERSSAEEISRAFCQRQLPEGARGQSKVFHL